jgi:hypothetical protein
MRRFEATPQRKQQLAWRKAAIELEKEDWIPDHEENQIQV